MGRKNKVLLKLFVCLNFLVFASAGERYFKSSAVNINLTNNAATFKQFCNYKYKLNGQEIVEFRGIFFEHELIKKYLSAQTIKDLCNVLTVKKGVNDRKNKIKGIYGGSLNESSVEELVKWSANGKKNPQEEIFRIVVGGMLKKLSEFKINSIFFHFKPDCGVLWPSELAPFSKYIAGKLETDMLYDPVEIIFQEADKLNMYVHPWFNPYRSVNTCDVDRIKTLIDSKNKKIMKYPLTKWLYNDKSKAFSFNRNYFLLSKNANEGSHKLNPCNKETMTYICDIAKELIENYGAHKSFGMVNIDDFFYPELDKKAKNKAKGEFEAFESDEDFYKQFEKSVNMKDFEAEFNNWKKNRKDKFMAIRNIIQNKKNKEYIDGLIADFNKIYSKIHYWRVKNCKELIKRLHETCKKSGKKVGKNVMFGVSPAGSVLHNYFIGADVITWVDEGHLDFLAPQNYYGHNGEKINFENGCAQNDYICGNYKSNENLVYVPALGLYKCGVKSTIKDPITGEEWVKGSKEKGKVNGKGENVSNIIERQVMEVRKNMQHDSGFSGFVIFGYENLMNPKSKVAQSEVDNFKKILA